jgi:hypothetical protein
MTESHAESVPETTAVITASAPDTAEWATTAQGAGPAPASRREELPGHTPNGDTHRG